LSRRVGCRHVCAALTGPTGLMCDELRIGAIDPIRAVRKCSDCSCVCCCSSSCCKGASSASAAAVCGDDGRLHLVSTSAAMLTTAGRPRAEPSRPWPIQTNHRGRNRKKVCARDTGASGKGSGAEAKGERYLQRQASASHISNPSVCERVFNSSHLPLTARRAHAAVLRSSPLPLHGRTGAASGSAVGTLRANRCVAQCVHMA
jgi:hypothetical protein